jgi:hypothetical protein
VELDALIALMRATGVSRFKGTATLLGKEMPVEIEMAPEAPPQKTKSGTTLDIDPPSSQMPTRDEVAEMAAKLTAEEPTP